MSVTMRFALRSLRGNRARTIVSIAGVALAAALLTGVLACYWSLRGLLLDREVALEGDWAVSVWPQDVEHWQALTDDPIFSENFWTQDVGFADTGANRSVLGHYLTVLSMGGDPTTVALRLTEGRLPENDTELLVPDTWALLGTADWSVGSTVTLDLGQRQAVAAPELATLDDDERDYYERLVDTGLDSGTGYFDPESDGGVLAEQLVDTEPRTYTVVGVYDVTGQVGSTGVGSAALTAGGDEPAAFTAGSASVKGYLRAAHVTSVADLDQAVLADAPNSAFTTHNSYLRYAGFSMEIALEDTFFWIAGTLGAVVVVACIALVGNAFSISVAQRTRQFALLASIGATPRQLRSCVLVEALVVGVAGVALGLAAGVAGSAAALAFVAPHVENLLGAVTALDGTPVTLTLRLDWLPLVVAGVATLAAVLVAAWLPAHRAAKTDIVCELRGANGARPVRIGHDEQGQPWARTGLAGHLLGTPGRLAVLDRRRSPSHGRTATVSLALAVLLLVTAGAVAASLETLVEASGADIDYPVDLTADRLTGTPAEVQSAMEELSRAEDADLEGWSIQAWGVTAVPEAMQGATLREVWEQSGDETTVTTVQQGSQSVSFYPIYESELAGTHSVLAPVTVNFLSDQAFSAWAREQGVDPTPYLDAAGRGEVMAVGLATAWDNTGDTYALGEVLSETGSLKVLLTGTYDDQQLSYVSASEDGTVYVMLTDGTNVDETDGTELWASSALTIDVAALAESAPVTVSQRSVAPTLIAPASALTACGSPALTLSAGFDATDPAAATDELNTLAQQELGDLAAYVWVTDQTADASSNRSLAVVIELFSGLMSGVLALIAVANLFNTLTNGLILRQREFAVLRSAGLSKRGLAQLVGYQCAGQTLRGLVLGLVLAVPVAAVLEAAVSYSVTGVRFSVPWVWVAGALLGCAAVTALSCWYGLRRCDDVSLLTALRAD